MSSACEDEFDDGNERDHDDDDGEHEPSEPVRPVRVDVVAQSDRRVINDREHQQKLQPPPTDPPPASAIDLARNARQSLACSPQAGA